MDLSGMPLDVATESHRGTVVSLMRLRLAGATTGEITVPMMMARQRRARMALPRGTADGMPASEPDPTPSVVRRSESEINRMRAVAELAAGIGRNIVSPTDPGFNASPEPTAEGFLLCLKWLAGDADDMAVLLNWMDETGRLPK